MTLPVSARLRLARPLRDNQSLRREIRKTHTIPIDATSWRLHATALAEAIDCFAALLVVPGGDYPAIQDWTSQLIKQRRAALSLLFSLEPFEPFDTKHAREAIRLIDQTIRQVSEATETGSKLSTADGASLIAVATWWRSSHPVDEGESLLQRAFGTDVEPRDGQGDFRADWVLQHYAYQSGTLLKRLVPHQASLGILGVVDVLAATTVIGGILDADDPIAAYVAMTSFIDDYLRAPEEIGARVGQHLKGAEASLRRTHRIAIRAKSQMYEESDQEARVFALADLYKRVVEGQFRQFSWSLYCLRTERWERPPMLTGLRERLMAAGGLLAAVAEAAVIPDFRNSETHETLEWDGFAEEFVTEAGRLSPLRVAIAFTAAQSFAQGCEAGLSVVRALNLEPSGSLPIAGETGRMPEWRRALGFFGTNRLRVTEANLNTRNAQIRVARLGLMDINPCFQALVLARRLLREVETFSVVASDGTHAQLSVPAEALDLTMPIWEYAVSTLDRMPFSTFLPANLAARRATEDLPTATRSIAWIAVDDTLDAFNGSPNRWGREERAVLLARLRVVELALTQVQPALNANSARPISVRSSIQDLSGAIATRDPEGPNVVESLPALNRLRIQWERWGPVPRLPGIEGTGVADIVTEPQPGLLPDQSSFAYRTL